MSRDDGRKPTFAERDKRRRGGGSSGPSRAERDAERAQERLQNTQSYQDYKKSVEKIFGGGGEVPDALKDGLDPSGEKTRREQALKNLQKLEAEDRQAWIEAAYAFAMEFDLPDDAYLLDRLLDHPKARVVDKALSRLEALVEAGKLVGTKRPKSLEQRLKGIELTSIDDEQKTRAKALRERLG